VPLEDFRLRLYMAVSRDGMMWEVVILMKSIEQTLQRRVNEGVWGRWRVPSCIGTSLQTTSSH